MDFKVFHLLWATFLLFTVNMSLEIGKERGISLEIGKEQVDRFVQTIIFVNTVNLTNIIISLYTDIVMLH